jgi:NADPH:quinone reductase-like Zn-dependent oxidoreductase
MKAAVRDRYGPPEVVEIRQVERPVPPADGVLVRVRAASVNRADLDHLYPRWQFMRLFLGLRRPRTRGVGTDVAGVVEATGPRATKFSVGDEVFGDLFVFGQGAFAEYAAAPEKAFARMPPGLTFEEAATIPHSAVLALQGLRLRNGRTPQRGERVMVVGASGNVGPFAVQIAKSFGAEVTGVASAGKLDLVQSLGADHVIDYTAADYTRPVERYDWILDVEGRHSILRWRHALRPKGVYSALGGSALWFLKTLLQGPAVSVATGKRMGIMLWWKPFRSEDVATLSELIAAGKVKPVIDRRFPLDEAARALRYLDDGHARGKVVISAA